MDLILKKASDLRAVLRGEIEHYREYLSNIIKAEDIKPAELVDRWIPNVIGEPFSLEKSYLEKVQVVTGSEALKRTVATMS